MTSLPKKYKKIPGCKYYTVSKLGLRKPPRPRLGKEVPCEVCGNLTYKRLYELKKRSVFYCSRSCVGKRKRGGLSLV